ncbi:MAG: PHB depolymerase family esterase [Rubrobacter sp.]|nr:PHB depolymerase family esterase [Rubrobacter sp.]
MQRGMAEATRLTREGRLAEATALIQRTLAGGNSPTSPETSEEVIDTAFVDEAPPSGASPSGASPSGASRPESVSSPATHGLRPAPPPKRRHRSGVRPPVGAPGAEEGFDVREAGRFIERSYSNRAGTRAYKLYVPSGYVGQEVSLVVMLHGCTQNPDDFAAGTGMNTLAEEHTFLVAYPAQTAGANMQKCWNWFDAGDQKRGGGEPSIIAGITCEVVGGYNVEPGRVYVAGMSAGGAMAAIMGAEYPDLYAAVGVHSGLAPGSARDLASAFSAMHGGGKSPARRDGSGRTTPIISFHGDRDTTVHPRNADNLLAHYVADDDSPSAVKVRQGQSPGGYVYTRAARHDSEGRAVAEQWTIRGLGHAWSGGRRSGSYTDAKGPDASAEMVRFFHQLAPTNRPAD